MSINMSPGSSFLHGIMRMNFLINPWHHASPSASHFKRQAMSPKSFQGNKDCVIKTRMVETGPPTVEIFFDNGSNVLFDFTNFRDTRKLTEEIELLKKHHRMTRLLKDDDWDDMEDSTHASVDAFLKELREGRDPKADAAFDEIWNCNDPVQMKEYEQKELAEIVAARKAEKSRKHRRGYYQ